jgi:type IV pilus assembly protein PilA
MDKVAGGSNVLFLTPVSGLEIYSDNPAAALVQSDPVVWGCGVKSTPVFKYVPANCRFVK